MSGRLLLTRPLHQQEYLFLPMQDFAGQCFILRVGNVRAHFETRKICR